MKPMNKRLGRLLVMVAIILVLMTAPLMWLNHKLNTTEHSAAYQDLKTYSESLNGNIDKDAEALRIHPTLTIKNVDGRQVYYKGDSENCWELDIKENPNPTQTDPSNCTS